MRIWAYVQFCSDPFQDAAEFNGAFGVCCNSTISAPWLRTSKFYELMLTNVDYRWPVNSEACARLY